MELLRQSKHRTILSETLYIVLNVLMAVAILAVIYYIGSLVAAFALVLLSKWRIFAVRPRHWFAHLVSNLVDIIVGLSFVVFVATASGFLVVQLLLTLLYIAWLLLLKPRSKRKYVVLQAGIGLFVGVAALMQVSYEWWSSAVVLLMWVIGYSTARHTLTAYSEPHVTILSLIFGLVLAEIGWITYHWTMAYSLGIDAQFMLPQAAIIALLIGFLAQQAYASYHKNNGVKVSDMGLPLLFSLSIITLLLTLFGAVNTI